MDKWNRETIPMVHQSHYLKFLVPSKYSLKLLIANINTFIFILSYLWFLFLKWFNIWINSEEIEMLIYKHENLPMN